MATIGKITVTCTQQGTTEVIKVRTTGKKGSVLLNTITNDTGYASQSPTPDAVTFYTAVLTRAISQL